VADDPYRTDGTMLYSHKMKRIAERTPAQKAVRRHNERMEEAEDVRRQARQRREGGRATPIVPRPRRKPEQDVD
jgi:hypothetical protein